MEEQRTSANIHFLYAGAVDKQIGKKEKKKESTQMDNKRKKKALLPSCFI